MSKQHEANNTYSHGIEAGFTRTQIIAEIAIEVGVSPGYASTLYNNARRASAPAPTTKPMVKPTTKTSGSSTDVTEFNRANLKNLRKQFQDAINAVAAKNGIKAGLGSISYTDSQFTVKMTVETSGNKEAKVEKAKNGFPMDAFRVGLKEDALGKTFKSNGRTFKITGVKTRRRKYPVSAVEVGGRGGKFKFPVSATGMAS